MIHTLFDNDRIFILGHRGCSQSFPENTMASFADCAANPAVDGVELDVHLCRSGEVVVCHDSSLMRTAGLDVRVEDLTYDELKDVDVGSFKDSVFADQRVPLLEDLFTTFGSRFVYDIELKVDKFRIGRRLCAAVWDLIQKHSLEGNVMVSSFNPFALRRFNRVCWYSVPTADIFDRVSVPRLLRNGQGHLISGSSYLKPQMDCASVEFFKEKELPIIVWTVNTEEDASSLLDIEGVRGLIGNDPHILAKVLKSKKSKFSC